MKKLSQKELLSEGFADIVKNVGKGVGAGVRAGKEVAKAVLPKTTSLLGDIEDSVIRILGRDTNKFKRQIEKFLATNHYTATNIDKGPDNSIIISLATLDGRNAGTVTLKDTDNDGKLDVIDKKEPEPTPSNEVPKQETPVTPSKSMKDVTKNTRNIIPATKYTQI